MNHTLYLIFLAALTVIAVSLAILTKGQLDYNGNNLPQSQIIS